MPQLDSDDSGGILTVPKGSLTMLRELDVALTVNVGMGVFMDDEE